MKFWSVLICETIPLPRHFHYVRGFDCLIFWPSKIFSEGTCRANATTLIKCAGKYFSCSVFFNYQIRSLQKSLSVICFERVQNLARTEQSEQVPYRLAQFLSVIMRPPLTQKRNKSGTCKCVGKTLARPPLLIIDTTNILRAGTWWSRDGRW